MLGAGRGMPWLALIVVPLVLVLHLALSANKKAEVLMILSAAMLGFCIDSLLISAEVFTPVEYLSPMPLSPPWMVLLWMNFATTINVSLKRLHGRYLLSAVLGAIGGPAAYYSGAKLGAMTSLPDRGDLAVLAAAWAVSVPLLFRVAEMINHRLTNERFS